MNNVFGKLETASVRLFCAYIALTLVLATFLAPFIEYACKRPFIAMNYAYVIIAALTAICIIGIIRRTRHSKLARMLCTRKAFVLVVSLSTFALLALQACVVKGGWFVTGWDIATLTDFGNSAEHASYYSTYPNQYFLAGLFSAINQLCTHLGFSNGYLGTVSVGCACVALSVALCACIARQIGGYATGYAALGLAFVFAGLSPWILVPYSDAYGMLFPAFILFAYTCIKNKPLKWFLMVFATMIGYSIKPTVVFTLLAIIAVELLELGRLKCISLESSPACSPASNRTAKIARIGATAFSMALAYVLSSATISAVSIDSSQFDDEGAFSFTHYLMMGSNTERWGTFNGLDVEYSLSFDTKEERQKANIERWKERMKTMGPVGAIVLFTEKNLSNYADGTMAWEWDGPFYIKTGGKSNLVKNFYGIDEAKKGEVKERRDALFGPLFQTIWMLILLGIAVGLFIRNTPKELCVIALALIMLSVFLMIFECRARYLFLYIPLYIVFCVQGWKALSSRIGTWQETKRGARRNLGKHAR